jgi:DNA-binding XRE family transcriptional regulator
MDISLGIRIDRSTSMDDVEIGYMDQTASHGCVILVFMPLSRTTSPDAIRFGAIIQRLRLARGWPVVKLARRAGMNPQYVGVLERGGNNPTLSTVLELAEVLGADAGAIVRELALARNPPPVPPDSGKPPLSS